MQAAAATSEASEQPGGLSEYEQKRQAKMAANAQFLQELGMASMQLETTRQLQQKQKTGQAKKRSRSQIPFQEVQPVRRSRRLRGEAVPGSAKPETPEEDDEASDFVLEHSFTESRVLRYAVNGDGNAREAPPLTSEDDPSRELVGFHLDPRSYLADHELRKAYCISFTGDKDHGLVAAAGSNGRVSIFPLSNSYHQPEIVDGFVDDPAAHMPLVSFKAHSGWVSATSLARSVRGADNLLLTASNDASVKLWDLNHSSSTLRTPKEMFTCPHLHRKGIFGMDVCGDAVLTCSKDATIALSQFSPDTGALVVDRRFKEHEGVVKCVRFVQGSPSCFASGGNDREVRVYDARVGADPLVVRIQGVHARAVNSVQFHPADGNLLLSAGFDPSFYLCDLRRAAHPVCEFLQPPGAADSKAIFHPAFVRNGRAVVAARGHDLSLYRTCDGAAVSRGVLDEAATCLAVDPFHDRIALAQSGRLQFADARWDTQ
jgi:hypothetical protein